MSRYDVDAIIHAIFMFGIMIIFLITSEKNADWLNWLYFYMATYHAVSYIYCQAMRSKEDDSFKELLKKIKCNKHDS